MKHNYFRSLHNCRITSNNILYNISLHILHYTVYIIYTALLLIVRLGYRMCFICANSKMICIIIRVNFIISFRRKENFYLRACPIFLCVNRYKLCKRLLNNILSNTKL